MARRLGSSSVESTAEPPSRRATEPSIETVPVSALIPGDRIDVGAGEELAADGRVVEGSGQVRMALVTGESAPVLIGPGDRVVAGAVLVDGALTVAVEAAAQDSVVHRMAAELHAAQDRGMAPTSADRIAPWFTAATLVVGALTFIAWLVFRGAGSAVANTVAVLVVACPCALALAQPLSTAAGVGAAARRGLLLRSADALLKLARVNVAALDKTGTVTAGALVVTDASDSTLRIAAGLERYSGHPIARAIIQEAAERGIPLPRATGVRETPGVGISGVMDGERWELRASGPGTVELSSAGAPRGETHIIRFGDAIRSDARAAVKGLRSLGLRTTLLTGDYTEVADHIGRQAAVDDVVARVEPAGKVLWIRERQAAGERVVFVGDGLNDGPALAVADVGIAMGTGVASSLLAADGIVSAGVLAPVAAGIRAGRAAERMMRFSQHASIVYNVLAVGAAAAGLVNPLVAAILMPLSSVVVVWNAMRVERVVRAGD
jgi:heavy metal translocating P-type ATPase